MTDVNELQQAIGNRPGWHMEAERRAVYYPDGQLRGSVEWGDKGGTGKGGWQAIVGTGQRSGIEPKALAAVDGVERAWGQPAQVKHG